MRKASSKNKAQASSEQMMILGAVLIVGLVVVALLMSSGPDTTSDKQAAASMTYWSNAQPIAIREAHAGPTGETGLVANHNAYMNGFYITMKNTGKEPIIIRSISMGSSLYSSIWTYDHLENALQGSTQGQCQSGVEADCPFTDNHDHLCNFVLSPSDELTVGTKPDTNWLGAQCSNYPENPPPIGQPSINSVRKSIAVPVSIWYEQNGVLQVEKGAVDLYMQCQNYWACTGGTPDDCAEKYGCGSYCINGACTSGMCVLCG